MDRIVNYQFEGHPMSMFFMDEKVPDLPPLTITSKSIIIEQCQKKLWTFWNSFSQYSMKSNTSKNYKNASVTILSHVFDHECKVSLFSLLFNKDYSFSLFSRSNSFYENMNKFEIQIHQTKQKRNYKCEINWKSFSKKVFQPSPHKPSPHKPSPHKPSPYKPAPHQISASDLFLVEIPEDTLKSIITF
ncbi:hypothetical protein ACTFIZ_004965 [Dictyostelium cf. discoideum]